jgi:peptide/nickel transport system permease protein
MSYAWKQFRKNKAALFGLVTVVVITTAAILAPVLAPYDPNEQFFDGLTAQRREIS